jgi:hypothetical protein
MTSKCKSDKYLAFASAAIVCWDTLQIFDTTKIKKNPGNFGASLRFRSWYAKQKTEKTSMSTASASPSP